MNSRVAVPVAVLGLVATFAGPQVAADQGRGGDYSDWGCGGHPSTAASQNSGEAERLLP